MGIWRKLKTMLGVFEEFHRQHEAFYGYRIGGEIIQLVHFNVSAIGVVPKPSLQSVPPRPQPEPVAVRHVYFEEEDGFIECPIYRRSDFGTGTELSGPAIIEEVDSTTLLHLGQRLVVDEFGIMVLSV